MDKKVATPGYVKVMAWTISLFAFSLGFWHTHLGLREFKALSSSYGSLIIAGIIVMVLIVAYQRAINGVKAGLYFYLLCALFLFTFNVNSFYPSYLGRQLIKEEAISLNDSLHNYSARLDSATMSAGSSFLDKINRLKNYKENLLQEIGERSGFGEHAKAQLKLFNDEAGSRISEDRDRGRTDEERRKRRNYFDSVCNQAINAFIIKTLSVSDKNALVLFNSKLLVDSIKNVYTPKLSLIIQDNSKIQDLDSIRYDPQIITMLDLVTEMDNVSKNVNTALGRSYLKQLRNVNTDQVPVPKTASLGRFAFTIDSVFTRINKYDTWGILILCLFIDFIVPLAMYSLIRTDSNEKSIIKYKPETF